MISEGPFQSLQFCEMLRRGKKVHAMKIPLGILESIKACLPSSTLLCYAVRSLRNDIITSNLDKKKTTVTVLNNKLVEIAC